MRRATPRCTQARHGLSIRYNEDLDPNEGPGFGCFVTQAILFAIILLLIPVGLFTFGWPMWVLVALLVVAMILLFFVSMTSVFLLRVFFADRRRGRGRQTGVAKAPTRVISTDEEEPMTDGRSSDAADGDVFQRAQGPRRALQARHAPRVPDRGGFPKEMRTSSASTASASSAGST